MLRILFIILFSLGPGAWAAELQDDFQCTGQNKSNDKPFLRISLSPSGFENQVEKILKQIIPTIEESVSDIKLYEQTIGHNKPSCPEYRDGIGMEAESLCLYLPKIIFGEPIRLRHFKEDIKSSIGIKMNYDEIQISEFKLENPDIECDFKSDKAICEIKIDVPVFKIQSHIDFVDPRKQIKLFSTISPLSLEAKAKDKLIPQIHLKATLDSHARAIDAIKIVKDSIKLFIPEGTLTSDIPNNEQDSVDRAISLLEDELDPNLTNEESSQEMLRLLDSPRGEEILQSLSLSYALIKTAKDFFGDVDMLALYQKPLLDHVDEPLSVLLSNIIEKALPFNDNVEFKMPLPPTQDQIDGSRYFKKFQEISDYLDSVDDDLKVFSSYRLAKGLRRSHYNELKKIERFINNIRNTQLKDISAELSSLAIRLGAHKTLWEDFNLISKSLSKKIDALAELAKETSTFVIGSSIPAYRKSLLHIDRVDRVESSGLSLLVSGCHIGGLTPDVSDNWYRSAANRPTLDSHDFAVEMPVSLLNQHLKLLHQNGFYNYCTSRNGKSCAEVNKSARTSFKIIKSPVIRKHNGQYVFEMPEVERTAYSILPDFLDKAFLQDNSRIRVCLDNLVVDSKTGRLIPKGCIDAGANVEKNFRLEHALSFVNLWSAVAVFGIKLTHSAAQDQILNDMADHELARSVDDILMRNGEYEVRELRVLNERLSIFGNISTKSE